MKSSKLSAAACLASQAVASAAHAAGSLAQALPTAGQGMLRSLASLAIVLVVIAALAWLMKRLRRASTRGANVLKLVADLPVGTKERVAVVECADSWILIGIAAGRVNPLHVMPKGSVEPSAEKAPDRNFAYWLEAMRSRDARR
jgi:flagellar protein FliO/FliZ